MNSKKAIRMLLLVTSLNIYSCSMIKKDTSYLRLPSNQGSFNCTDATSSIIRDHMKIAQAKKIFNVFKDNNAINWGLKHNSCQARADKMAEIADDLGYEVKKIWAQPGGNGDPLNVILNQSGTENIEWNFHVAVVAQVKNGDRSEAMVFDPALFDEPVPLSLWEERFKKFNPDVNFRVTDRFRYNDPDDVVTDSLLEVYKRERDQILAETFDSNEIDTLIGIEIHLRGDWADKLKNTDPEKFRKLAHFLEKNGFDNWWRTYYSKAQLSSMVEESELFLGVKKAKVKSILSASNNEDANFKIKAKHWETIGNFFEQLEERYRKLRSSNSELAREFISESREDGFTEKWFSPEGFELWEKYGL